MPPLSSPRFNRRARGLVAVAAVFIGAVGGPVGPAGAGAPAERSAAATANTTSLTSNSADLVTPTVTDRLGTHTGEILRPLGKKDDPVATRSGICDPSVYGGGFGTGIGSNWSSLAIRSRPCTGSSGVGTYGTTSSIWVERETQGEFICRGRTYGYGSSIWFRTNRGYIWSGGTDHPRWNRSC